MDDPLELGVFLLELLRPPQLKGHQAAKLFAPDVIGRMADPRLRT